MTLLLLLKIQKVFNYDQSFFFVLDNEISSNITQNVSFVLIIRILRMEIIEFVLLFELGGAQITKYNLKH